MAIRTLSYSYNALTTAWSQRLTVCYSIRYCRLLHAKHKVFTVICKHYTFAVAPLD